MTRVASARTGRRKAEATKKTPTPMMRPARRARTRRRPKEGEGEIGVGDEITRAKHALDAMVDAARESRPGYDARSNPIVDVFTPYEDASGVGCRISWEGYIFTFDVRGKVEHTLVRAPHGGTRAHAQIALELCTQTFLTELVGSVDVAWREKNIQLYGLQSWPP